MQQEWKKIRLQVKCIAKNALENKTGKKVISTENYLPPKLITYLGYVKKN